MLPAAYRTFLNSSISELTSILIALKALVEGCFFEDPGLQLFIISERCLVELIGFTSLSLHILSAIFFDFLSSPFSHKTLAIFSLEVSFIQSLAEKLSFLFILISKGPTDWKLKPLSGSSNCLEEIPKSKNIPSIVLSEK